MLIKKLFSSVGLFAIGRLTNILAQFAFNAILVRVLLKQEVADFFLTFSLISFLSLLVTFGVENIAIKRFLDLINKNTSLSVSAVKLFFAFISVNLIMMMLVLVLISISYLFNLHHVLNIHYSNDILPSVFIWIWSQALLLLLTEILRSFGRFVLTTMSAGIIVNLVNIVLLYIYYVYGNTQGYEILLFLVSMNVAIVCILFTVVVFILCLRFDREQSKVKESSIYTIIVMIFRDSSPSFLNKLGIYFTILADIWLISVFFDKEMVADYGVAAKLAVTLSIFLSISNGLVPVYISKFKNFGMKKTEQFLRFLATSIALPTFVLFLLLYFKSDFIITFIFGKTYLSSVGFLSILLLGQIVNVVVGSCGYMLVMEGQNTSLMKISIFSGILAVVLSVLSVNAGLGSLSIAWSFTVGIMFRNVATYISAKRLCGVNTAIYLSPTKYLESFKMVRNQQVFSK